ncbi:MAG TPA: DUF1858 domain-containing protein [Patescibacteria group bacterium]
MDTKKNIKKQLITKDMLIVEMVERFPDAAQVLIEDYGFHCFGCFASAAETLEQGAMVHGMDDEEIKVMIESLNELAQPEEKK